MKVVPESPHATFETGRSLPCTPSLPNGPAPRELAHLTPDKRERIRARVSAIALTLVTPLQR